MTDFEGLGVFYLGRRCDAETATRTPEPLLYESRDLATHAVCVGMTGSGKTGLCLSLLEEAALDGIPVIAIDPKGDLGNLLLAFPDLRPADFRPWIDAEAARRAGRTPEAEAESAAKAWREGLAEWGQDGERIRRFRDAVDAALYTPGGSAGRPLSILGALAPRPAAAGEDREVLRDRVRAAASGLLALAGIDADPLQSREQVLLERIVESAWGAGRALDLAELVRAISSPPFERVGVLDLETFFPAAERAGLALRINNLVAASGFEAWLAGEPLDVERLLWTPAGKPRLSILSIAHLADAERSFFVTLFLSELIGWMRAQSGTGSLRAIVYMDEVFGFFPPVANPPTKPPMLTLLKQARAYGLGLVLATQNPVDLDYKGLSNAGTWFIGRLQTERDQLRVLDGLEGAAAAAGRALDRARLQKLLAGLPRRVFLLNNVHEDAPVLFHTRWALSYLRGPLSREQVRALTRARASAGGTPDAASAGDSALGAAPAAAIVAGARPVVPSGIEECFVGGGAAQCYVPRLLGALRLHYADAKLGLDHWTERALVAPIGETANPWERAEPRSRADLALAKEPARGARFAELPGEAARPKSYAAWSKKLGEHAYRVERLALLAAPALGLVSRPGEGEGEFRARVALATRERRDDALARLEQKYAPVLRRLQDRLARAEQRVDREESQYRQRKVETGLSVGASILGALLGRKLASAGNIGRAATAARSATRAARERDDIAGAKESAEEARRRLDELEREFRAEAGELQAAGEPAIERLEVAPRKSDIAVEGVALLWIPAGPSPGVA